jgi:hypothetical protein
VIVISLGTPRSAGENFGCTWKHLGALATSLGAPAMCLESPARSLGMQATSLRPLKTSLNAPTTSLGVPRITLEQAGNNIFFGNLQVRLEIIATTYHSMIVQTHVFRLYYHLCIYISMYLCIDITTHLHRIYLNWLQAVLVSNWRCAWKWWFSELRDTLWCHDWASLEMHLQEVIEHIWSYT